MRSRATRSAVVCLRLFLLLGFGVGASASLARADDGAKFLEGDERRAFMTDVEKRMSAVRSIVARFDQEKHLSYLKRPFKTSGFILFVRPDQLRWEIREPFRSVLIVSSDRVAKFEYLDGSRKKLELGRRGDVIAMVMDRIRAWFLGKFDQDSRHYDIQVRAKPEPLVVLSPKDASIGKSLRSIELRLSKELDRVVSVTILEKNGDRTHMKFELARRNGELPATLFSTTDPDELDPKAFPEYAPRHGPKHAPKQENTGTDTRAVAPPPSRPVKRS